MNQGIALNVGVNLVSSNYEPPPAPLRFAEQDAKVMAGIAKAQGFKPITKLMGKQATRLRVIESIDAAAQVLKEGDVFFLSYSGHGGRVKDEHDDELDLHDEAWCLYDGQLIDDQICACLSRFRPGVRVLMFSVSCNSGTLMKELPEMKADLGARPFTFAEQVLLGQVRKTVEDLQAQVLLFSACPEDQTDSDTLVNSPFTRNIIRVWRQGTSGTYPEFFRRVRQLMPKDTQPLYVPVTKLSPEFELQKPFTI